MKPPLWEEQLVDGMLLVTDDEAMHWARELGRVEGIFGGFSAGASPPRGSRLLQELPETRVVFLVNDSGLKYLSTDLWP